MRSCVGGNCDVDDVSWLCQVQVAPVLMCMVMMMVVMCPDIGDGGDYEIGCGGGLFCTRFWGWLGIWFVAWLGVTLGAMGRHMVVGTVGFCSTFCFLTGGTVAPFMAFCFCSIACSCFLFSSFCFSWLR